MQVRLSRAHAYDPTKHGNVAGQGLIRKPSKAWCSHVIASLLYPRSVCNKAQGTQIFIIDCKLHALAFAEAWLKSDERDGVAIQ